MRIAVLGSGNVGGTLGNAWARAGHEVVFGMRDGSQASPLPGTRAATVLQAIQDSDVVALAVPWPAVPAVLGQVRDWSGKVLIDCTNPIGPGFQLALGFNSSGAEKVATLAPGARVAKAFNTTGFNNMKNPLYGGKPITMPFCADDPAAQKAAERLIRDVGFEPLFAGPLRQARYLEPFAMLWITMSQQQGREFAFTLVRR